MNERKSSLLHLPGAQLANLSQLSQLRLQPQMTYDPKKTSLRSLDLPSPSNVCPSRCGAKLHGVPSLSASSTKLTAAWHGAKVV